VTRRVLRVYSRPVEAGSVMWVGTDLILACCRGDIPEAHGFGWRYYDGPPITAPTPFTSDETLFAMKDGPSPYLSFLAQYRPVYLADHPAATAAQAQEQLARIWADMDPVARGAFADGYGY
jgi:hypothetical protein